MGARMGKRGKWKDDALQWTTDTGEFDRELTALSRTSEGRPEFVAPGVEQKWRARNLVDIHWALTAIKTPSESYNRVLSCIIDHTNPHNGLCYPSQSIIAIETGVSVKTVKRAIRWWKKQKFLETESRGLGHALAYHPQWDLLESHWVAVTTDIEELKASRVTKGTYDEASEGGTGHVPTVSPRVTKGTYGVGHQGDLREGHQGDLREGHHADLQNLKLEPQTLTSKNESHPERVRLPSVADTSPLEKPVRENEEAFSEEPVERLSPSPQTPEPPESPSSSELRKEAEFHAHTRLEAGLGRLPRALSDAVREWLPYPGEVYDAAIAAEIDTPNTGAVVVLDAYRMEKSI
jgi:hypothetical protein